MKTELEKKWKQIAIAFLDGKITFFEALEACKEVDLRRKIGRDKERKDKKSK